MYEIEPDEVYESNLMLRKELMAMKIASRKRDKNGKWLGPNPLLRKKNQQLMIF